MILGALRFPMLSAQTTGTSTPVNCAGFTNLTVYLTASAALSAGTLIVEESDWNPTTEGGYSGTWSQIASYTLASVFASAGGQAAQHLQASAFANVRARIGTTVEGGTVSATLVGA